MEIQPRHVTMLIAGVIGLAFVCVGGLIYLIATGVPDSKLAIFTGIAGVVVGSLSTLAVNRSKSSSETLAADVALTHYAPNPEDLNPTHADVKDFAKA